MKYQLQWRGLCVGSNIKSRSAAVLLAKEWWKVNDSADPAHGKVYVWLDGPDYRITDSVAKLGDKLVVSHYQVCHTRGYRGYRG